MNNFLEKEFGKTLGRNITSPRNYLIYLLDFFIPKKANYWAFPVCFLNEDLICNLRGVFEEIKYDALIKKIILTRTKKSNPFFNSSSGKNVELVPLRSWKGLWLLLRSKVVFIRHTAHANVEYNLSYTKRHFVNLWHGIPLKRIGAAAAKNPKKESKKIRRRYSKKYSLVISSSDIDRLAMTAAMAPTLFGNVHITGLPRNDFILRDESELPFDFQAELKEISSLKGDKKLIFYAPTFRDKQEKHTYQFSVENIAKLKNILDKNNAILGIREHMADTSNSLLSQLHSLNPLDMNKYSNIEMIYRNADLLITDYSSCFIDFLLTNKPIVNFSHDYERYMHEERGFFYDMNMVFPNKICKNFDEMIISLEESITEKNRTSHYKNCKNLFFKYTDSNNSKRVVNLIKSEL